MDVGTKIVLENEDDDEGRFTASLPNQGLIDDRQRMRRLKVIHRGNT
jgi:hypothetical protein